MQLISVYIQGMLPYVFIGFIIYIIIRVVYIRKMKKKIAWLREIWLGIFAVYMIAVLSQTIVPAFTVGIDDLTGEVFFFLNKKNTNANINLVPFYTIYKYFSNNEMVDSWEQVSILNLMANILLFMPLGVLLPILWRRFNSLKSIIGFGIIFSFFIEFIQYFIGRSSDVDDIILNTLSVTMGYGIFIVCNKCGVLIYKKNNINSNKYRSI